jgi:hypothetical protein
MHAVLCSSVHTSKRAESVLKTLTWKEVVVCLCEKVLIWSLRNF